jgi:hypothetical protein
MRTDECDHPDSIACLFATLALDGARSLVETNQKTPGIVPPDLLAAATATVFPET